MIFKPELAAKVLDGSKTVTRRRCDGPCSYVAGRDYAVQPGRGKKALGRILIRDVEPQLLGWIDNADAVREGFADKGEFMDYWRRLYDGEFFRKQMVYRIEFELVQTPRSASDHRPVGD